MGKLSFKHKLLIFFGYKYLINQRSKEIHNLKHLHPNCHTELISKDNRFYGTKTDKDDLDSFFNGCRWCMKEESTD